MLYTIWDDFVTIYVTILCW